MSAPSDPPPRGWRRRTLEAAGLAVLSVVIVVALLFVSRPTAHTGEDLQHLDFGLPLAWVVQDQHLEPSAFPYVAQFNPWECATTVNPGALAVNVFAIWLALWLGLLGWRGVTSRRGGPPAALDDGDPSRHDPHYRHHPQFRSDYQY